jgi:hypothetical protein
MCLKAVETERKRLRKELRAERIKSRVKQIINNATYKRLAEESKRSWWDKHGWKVLGPTLIAVGAATAWASCTPSPVASPSMSIRIPISNRRIRDG